MTVNSSRRSGSSILSLWTAFGVRRECCRSDSIGWGFDDAKVLDELCNIIKSFESSLLRSENGLISVDEVVTSLAVSALTASEADFLFGNLFRAVSLC